MSNNVHDLSNRLLNALDNDYNVSFRVSKTGRQELESGDMRTVHEPVTPDSIAIWPLGKSSLVLSMCRCSCWEAVASARGGWRMCRCGRRPWVRMRGEVCSVRRGPGHWRRPLPPPLMCRSAKYFAMWKYGIVPRVTSPVGFRLVLSLCCAVGVLVFFWLMRCEYLVFTLVPRVIYELHEIYNCFQHWSGPYILYYPIWIAQ